MSKSKLIQFAVASAVLCGLGTFAQATKTDALPERSSYLKIDQLFDTDGRGFFAADGMLEPKDAHRNSSENADHVCQYFSHGLLRAAYYEIARTARENGRNSVEYRKILAGRDERVTIPVQKGFLGYNRYEAYEFKKVLCAAPTSAPKFD